MDHHPRLPHRRRRCLLLPALVAIVLLPACTSVNEVVDTVDKINKDSKLNTILTQERLKKIFTYNPKQPIREVPHSYCYLVMQDIMCYNQQIPGAEYRLVGWQGTGSEEMPLLRALTDAEKEDLRRRSARSDGRKPLTPLEPVFVGKAPESKGTEPKVEINETAEGPIF